MIILQTIDLEKTLDMLLDKQLIFTTQQLLPPPVGLSACGDTDTFLTCVCRKLPLSLALGKNVMALWSNLVVSVFEKSDVKK